MSASQSEFDEFLVYPNESIDKLTVNRSFSRLHDAITSKTNGSASLTVGDATELKYGKAQFSTSDKYAYKNSETISEDYSHRMMKLSQLKDFAQSILTDTSMGSYQISGEETDLTKNHCWVKFDDGGFSFIDVPNGNKMFISSFDIGIKNLEVMFNKTNIASDDVNEQTTISGYTSYIDISRDDLFAIRDFIEDDDLKPTGYTTPEAEAISGFDGKQITVPYTTPVSAKLKHNQCNWTSYSSFEQSYVEITFSVSINLADIYNKYVGWKQFKIIHTFPNDSTETITTSAYPKPFDSVCFTEKPVIMSQVSFYNNESRILPCYGYCKLDKDQRGVYIPREDEMSFMTTNTLTESNLSEESVNDVLLSPVNGMVVYKEFKNIFNQDGSIKTNVLNFDVSMKFMVGSAADPHKVDGINDICAKAKVQVMMIGV